MGLIEQVTAGNARAVGRVMSLLEDGSEEAPALLRGMAPHLGRAHLVGFTGPPGAGKSTLIAALALAARSAGRTVGIVAADPSSAFTGGALLGDRIRMRALFEDPHVFIRSMATREHPGCLPPAARDVCRVLDAMGKDLVFLETVGTGQSDIAVVRYADTVVLVLSPATGDYIQAMKAGSMEVADLIVVNKADLPGSEQAASDLGRFLHARDVGAGVNRDADRWEVPVVRTCPGGDGAGVEELQERIDAHLAHAVDTGGLADRRRRRLRYEIADYCTDRVTARLLAADRLDDLVTAVEDGRLTAREAGHTLTDELLGS